MRTLINISESLIESFNKNEVVNFIDLRDLEIHAEKDLRIKKCLDALVASYNERRKLTFMEVKNVEIIASPKE